MDYDRNDALLHWLFRQTQGDAWFRPNEANISSGVALRINETPEFRVFPYENANLEPFETAVCGLNPVVAVKVRSAAVHAALAEVGPDETSIHVDSNTRIQILDTMLMLPRAEKEQCAAFIRDERVLVIWSYTLDTIVATCNDFEDRLIKLLWRSRPAMGTPTLTTTSAGTGTPSAAGSVREGSMDGAQPGASGAGLVSPVGVSSALAARAVGEKGKRKDGEDEKEKKSTSEGSDAPEHTVGPKIKRTWYGRKILLPSEGDLESGVRDAGNRSVSLYAPLYNGLAAGLALLFIGEGIKTLLQEWMLDGDFVRFALIALIPLLYCVSLFFTLQLVQNVTMAIGPIAHFHSNSKYYSALKPKPHKGVDNALPHVTIQMPVYKESLGSVLAPSIESLKKAMQTYARQGGTSTIFINDDGLRLISSADRDERLAYYANHGIGWVARPKHDDAADGFKRAGRFKKASNMNYGLSLSLKAEKHLEALLATKAAASVDFPVQRSSLTSAGSHLGHAHYGMQYQNREGDDQSSPTAPPGSGSSNTSNGPEGANSALAGSATAPADEDLEEKALGLAIEEMFEESGGRWRPWAANGRATRMGEIVLIVDSDTVVPEDCLRDAAREMKECPTVAIIQHESDVMQVAHHYFENGISYFTRRINRCISMSCANGEVAPFMGHNAFLRWRAIQDAAFVDPADGLEKIWSESNVSEDFDMALRLILKGYVIRWATYSKGGFKEGVSLSVDDELNRWQKYAYGCSELLFNPFSQWLRKGPIAHQIHRFMWSAAPMHYKISMMAYMFSYYGIAASVTIAVINYVLLGFEFPVDGFYMRSFEIWLATNVIFWGSGTVGYTLLEYRLGHKQLVRGFLENLMWIPFFFFFFGGLSIPLSQAILAHLFSYNISWSATVKEVQRSNFFKEIPKIAKRFWFPLSVSIVIIAGMIILSTALVPLEWRVDGTGWGVIFPLSVITGCHVLFPIVLNPWLMVFSY